MSKTKKSRPWTYAEEDRLRLLYPIRQNEELVRLFSRTATAIKKKAHKLGIEKDYGGEYVRPHYIPENVWTDREVRELKHLYALGKTHNEISARLGRTPQAITSKAKKLRLRKNKSNSKYWSESDVDYLRRHYTEKGAAYVARHLSRTPLSVRHKAAKLGVKSMPNTRAGKRLWTPQDDKLLRQIYFKLPIEQVAQRLGYSVAGVKSRAWKLRLIKQERWTEQDEQQLRELYLTHSYAQIAEIMDRPLESVKAKGKRLRLQTKQNRKFLASVKTRRGINKDKPDKKGRWTKEEKNLLKKLYPMHTYEQIAEIMRRSASAVKVQSSRLGLTPTNQ